MESPALSPDGNRLVFGGHMGTAVLQQSFCPGVNIHWLGMVDPDTGRIDCSWMPQIIPFGHNYTGGWAMFSTPTQLWIGGFFTSISGVTQSGIARFRF